MESYKNADVLIVGSGIAGLSLALRLSDDIKVVLITKGKADECSTSWAQGGIASVTSKKDSFEKHLSDTYKNGHNIVNKKVATQIIEEGPSCINWLTGIGVPFTKDDNERLSLTLEAAHCERRIVHIDDKTGSVLHENLYNQVLARKNIKILYQHQIIDVISENNLIDNNQCIGAYVFNKKDKKI